MLPGLITVGEGESSRRRAGRAAPASRRCSSSGRARPAFPRRVAGLRTRPAVGRCAALARTARKRSAASNRTTSRRSTRRWRSGTRSHCACTSTETAPRPPAPTSCSSRSVWPSALTLTGEPQAASSVAEFYRHRRRPAARGRTDRRARPRCSGRRLRADPGSLTPARRHRRGREPDPRAAASPTARSGSATGAEQSAAGLGASSSAGWSASGGAPARRADRRADRGGGWQRDRDHGSRGRRQCRRCGGRGLLCLLARKRCCNCGTWTGLRRSFSLTDSKPTSAEGPHGRHRALRLGQDHGALDRDGARAADPWHRRARRKG